MKKITITLFVVYLISELSHKFYIEIVDFIALTEGQAIYLYGVGLVRLFSFYGLFLCCMIWSVFRYKDKVTFSDRVAYPICMFLGFSYCVSMTYFHGIADEIETEKMTILQRHPDFIETYEDYLNSERAKLIESFSINENIASTLYIDEGIIVDIVDENGKRVRYVPTKTDKQSRKSNQRVVRIAEVVETRY